MMRFAEIVENTSPLEPADYNLVAQQRDADRQKNALASQQIKQSHQKARKEKIWAKRPIVKPKPIKRLTKKRKRIK
jgi:hypothetical protein